ncbi:MAG: hypothetical protein WC762_03150 [Methylobacter sp.]|jgi:hypothetical protein
MAASDVDICNLALAHLGDEASVTSINPPDQSPQAAYCAKFYPISLAIALDDHNWGFATKTVTLALLTNPSSLWTYCYALPSTFINVQALFDAASVGDVGRITGSNQQEYSVETDDLENSIIYTNQSNAMLKYTSFVSNPTKFSPAFIDALSWRLAAFLAGPIIRGDVGVSASLKCMQAYQAALSNAKESDAQNRNVLAAPIPSGIKARA